MYNTKALQIIKLPLDPVIFAKTVAQVDTESTDCTAPTCS